MVRLRRDLARETLLYGLAMVVSGLVQFAFLPFMSRFLTPEQAGQLGVVRIISEVIAGLVVLGLPAALIRAWHRTGAAGALVTRSLTLPLVPLIVCGAAVAIWSNGLAGTFSLSSPVLLHHALALGGGVALLQISTAIPRARGMAGTYFLLQFARGIASLLLLLLLLSGTRGTEALSAFLEARWIPTIAAAVIAYLMMFRMTGNTRENVRQKGLTSELLAFSLPLVPASLALLVLSSADMFMLRTISSDLEQSGWYEWAGRTVLVLTPLTMGFSMAWQRYIFRKRKTGGRMDELGRSALLFMISVNWAAMVLALLSREIVLVFGGPQWLPAAAVIPWLAGAAALYALFTISQTGPLLTGQTAYIGWMTAFGAVLNIGFNFRLIPVAGATGAAFATLATNMFMAASLFWLGRKVFPVNFFAVFFLVALPVLSGPLAGLSPEARSWTVLLITLLTALLIFLLRVLGTEVPVEGSGGGDE